MTCIDRDKQFRHTDKYGNNALHISSLTNQDEIAGMIYKYYPDLNNKNKVI